MFSGIVECISDVVFLEPGEESVQLSVQRPKTFDDIRIGDSIAVNGVCLTVEDVNAKEIKFRLGAETLKVLGTGTDKILKMPLNLERSLKLGDRLHGHWVTGHVDAVGRIVSRSPRGDSLELVISVPNALKPYVWAKGSITLNGVSLTVNQVTANHTWDADEFEIEVCLIPETLKRTNLAALQPPSQLTVEADYYAKGIFQVMKHALQGRPLELS